MGGGAEGARERERIPSKFHAQCPAWCRLHLMTLKSWTEPNSRVGCSTDWATQGASRCHPLYKNLKIFLSFSIPLYKWSVLSTVDLWVSLKMWWSFYFQHFSFKKPWYLLTFFFFFLPISTQSSNRPWSRSFHKIFTHSAFTWRWLTPLKLVEFSIHTNYFALKLLCVRS